MPDLIAILDNEYRIVRANKAMATRLGLKPEECIGLTCYRALHGTASPPSFCPHRLLIEDGLEHTAEIFEECLGGYFILSVSPLYNSKGKIIGSVHARNSRIPIIILTGMNDEKIGIEAVKKGAQDYLVKGQVDGRLLKRSIQYSIERKKAEEKVQNLANIVESSNDAIVTRSLDGFITSWNLGAEQIYGYLAEEILGKPASVLIPWCFYSLTSKATSRHRIAMGGSKKLCQA